MAAVRSFNGVSGSLTNSVHAFSIGRRMDAGPAGESDMAVFGVYMSSRTKDGTQLDTALRERYRDVYRVGVEFWLLDARADAEDLADAMRPVLGPLDKMFVAVLKRDVVPVLSPAAHAWLNKPGRGWSTPRQSHGLTPPDHGETPFSIAA